MTSYQDMMRAVAAMDGNGLAARLDAILECARALADGYPMDPEDTLSWEHVFGNALRNIVRRADPEIVDWFSKHGV